MRVHYIAVIMLLAFTGQAGAQTFGATPRPGTLFPSQGLGLGPQPDVYAPQPQISPFAIGRNPPATIGPPVAGAPNVSTPGLIGTGATPSGLPGDDPLNPGFPKGPGAAGQ
jgi:hypothetical protein